MRRLPRVAVTTAALRSVFLTNGVSEPVGCDSCEFYITGFIRRCVEVQGIGSLASNLRGYCFEHFGDDMGRLDECLSVQSSINASWGSAEPLWPFSRAEFDCLEFVEFTSEIDSGLLRLMDGVSVAIRASCRQQLGGILGSSCRDCPASAGLTCGARGRCVYPGEGVSPWVGTCICEPGWTGTSCTDPSGDIRISSDDVSLFNEPVSESIDCKFCAYVKSLKCEQLLDPLHPELEAMCHLAHNKLSVSFEDCEMFCANCRGIIVNGVPWPCALNGRCRKLWEVVPRALQTTEGNRFIFSGTPGFCECKNGEYLDAICLARLNS